MTCEQKYQKLTKINNFQLMIFFFRLFVTIVDKKAGGIPKTYLAKENTNPIWDVITRWTHWQKLLAAKGFNAPNDNIWKTVRKGNIIASNLGRI